MALLLAHNADGIRLMVFANGLADGVKPSADSFRWRSIVHLSHASPWKEPFVKPDEAAKVSGMLPCPCIKVPVPDLA